MSDRKIWPNFFIVGAAKAGTTTLYEYLKETDGVYMSPVKEARFFHHPDISHKILQNVISDEKKYLKLFNKVTDEKAIGEASPSYLLDPESPEIIHKKIPNAKIIIMLRDPVQRAFSQYLMKKTNGVEQRTFHQVIEDYMSDYENGRDHWDRTIYAGLYTKNVKKYTDIFGLQNVKIIMFEEFVKDTPKYVKEVLDFLEVDSELPLNVGKVYNAYGEPRGKIADRMLANKLIWKIGVKIIPRTFRQGLRKKIFLKNKKKPKLPEEDGRVLQKFYKDDVNSLEKLLDRKLPWKWFN